MSNIHKLPGAEVLPGEPVTDTIEVLERMLERAKTGEVRSVAMVCTLGNRDVVTDWSNNNEFFALIGGVNWLKHRMLSAVSLND